MLHKPAAPWSNETKRGVRLEWSAIHPKARAFLFTEGTLQQLAHDNAEYAQALIGGEVSISAMVIAHYGNVITDYG